MTESPARFRTSALVLALLWGTAGVASAAEDTASAKAKALYLDGVKHYNLGRFPQALAAFEEAYLAKPDPVFLFNIGQCHRMVGDLKEQIYAYRRYLGESRDAPNRSEVEKFIAAAEAEIRRRQAAAPPLETLAPRPAAPPAVAEPPPRPAEEAASAEAPSRRRWAIGTAVAAGAVVAAGVAIAIAVALAGPSAPDHPGDTAGAALVRF